MELEDLDNISKNDFLPLVDKNNIKQELMDTGNCGTSGCASGSGTINNDNASTNIASEDSSDAGNLLCDSVEKQVNFSFLQFISTGSQLYTRYLFFFGWYKFYLPTSWWYMSSHCMTPYKDDNGKKKKQKYTEKIFAYSKFDNEKQSLAI